MFSVYLPLARELCVSELISRKYCGWEQYVCTKYLSPSKPIAMKKHFLPQNSPTSHWPQVPSLHLHQLHFPRLLFWVIISINITSKICRPPIVQIWELFPGTQPAASPVHRAGTDLSKTSCSAPKQHWRHPQMPGSSSPRPAALAPSRWLQSGYFLLD